MEHLESHSHLPVRIILSLELGEGLEYRGGDCSCGAVLVHHLQGVGRVDRRKQKRRNNLVILCELRRALRLLYFGAPNLT